MPWKETCPMDQRTQLIGDYLKKESSITHLHELYGVSRKTIHKWIARYKQDGPAGLEDRSRAPVNHPNATSPEIVSQIVNTRLRRPTWGPKKIISKLSEENPRID